MLHDPNDPFCTCEGCMTVAEKVKQELRQPKPPAINRKDDPAWAMFAAAFISGPWHPAMECSPHDQYKPSDVADFADAMLRERDRRDRGECEGPLDQEEWDEMQKARRDEA